MRNVDVIIQARMGSTRLPGKVLREVLGRPLLAYQIERVQRFACLRTLVVATSDLPGDDPVAELGRKLGVRVYRGSENDVLDRYYQAAREIGSETVMRLTGDCPLVDAASCDRVVAEFFRQGLEHVCTGKSYAEGLDCEVFSFALLEEVWKRAEKAFEREHVTSYVRNNPGVFRSAYVENEVDDSRYRITVDEPEDFEVVRAVFEALYPLHGADFGMERIRPFLDGHSEIFNLNSHVVRNEAVVKAIARGEIPPRP
ncbi:MAG: glycosyltransferase family protein [Desulfovibrionaceae bacterium]